MRRSISILYDGDFELNNKEERGVYSIFFVGTDKFYIGSTNSKEGFCGRWRQHLFNLRNNKHLNTILQKTYNKYGESRMKLKIVEICNCNDEQLWEKEQHYIDFLKPSLNVNLVARGCVFPEGWKSPISKPVLQYDLDGNFIKEFSSIKEAKDLYKVDIIQALQNLYRYTTQAGGYQWRLKTGNNIELKIPKYKYNQEKTILCYDSNGNFYKEYPSILKASIDLNLEIGNISKTVNGKLRSYNGYFFKEKTSDDYPLHINDILRLHKYQLSVDIEDLETGECYHFNSLRQIPKTLIGRCSLRPNMKKGLTDFVMKKRATGKKFRIRIQSYNKA